MIKSLFKSLKGAPLWKLIIITSNEQILLPILQKTLLKAGWLKITEVKLSKIKRAALLAA